jgi:hypothetical protein
MKVDKNGLAAVCELRITAKSIFTTKCHPSRVHFIDGPEGSSKPTSYQAMSRLGDMTEKDVRREWAAGEWPEVSDIDKVLSDARKAADDRRQRGTT